jgi:hypothetical protein
MTPGKTLALMRPWWMWKQKLIVHALRTAKLCYCLAAIEDALRRNRGVFGAPTTMKELASTAFLDRNPRNMERVEDGTYALTDQHLLGMALALKLPVQALVPDEITWIAGAVSELCGTGVSPADARLYALYRFECTQHVAGEVTEIDVTALQRIADRLDPGGTPMDDLQTRLENVAGILGRILQRCLKESFP